MNDLVSYDPNSGQNTSLGIQGNTWSVYVQNDMNHLFFSKGTMLFLVGSWETLGRFMDLMSTKTTKFIDKIKKNLIVGKVFHRSS